MAHTAMLMTASVDSTAHSGATAGVGEREIEERKSKRGKCTGRRGEAKGKRKGEGGRREEVGKRWGRGGGGGRSGRKSREKRER